MDRQWHKPDFRRPVSSLRLPSQVCFEFSGLETFSQEQVDTCTKRNSYIVLPNLNTADNINLSVQIVGDVLGDKKGGGTNAPALAQEYIRFAKPSSTMSAEEYLVLLIIR